MDDGWYLVAATPDGVHLYQVTAEQVDTVQEIEDLVGRVRADLEFPGGPGVVPEAPWSLDLHPGRPKDVADGVIEHDLRGTP